jgi:hypothetical protein
VVTGHYFLFSGLVLFLQNADVREAAEQAEIANCLRAMTFNYYFKFVLTAFLTTSPSFSSLPFLQPLLELPPTAQWERGTVRR